MTVDEAAVDRVCADPDLAKLGVRDLPVAAALGLPAVFVPYPHSNREQYRNARPVVDAALAAGCVIGPSGNRPRHGLPGHPVSRVARRTHRAGGGTAL